MKLSIVLSTQPASFSALAYKGRLAENIAKIKAFGYDGVELAIRDPKLLQLDEINSLLDKFNLAIPAIGTGQAFGEEGLSFTHPQKSIRRKAIDRIKSHIELAERFGAIVIIGLIRGKIVTEVGEEQAQLWFAEALKECALRNINVKLAIEPLNRYETNLINSVASGLRFLDKLNFENVGLLLDSFHMNIEEPSITQSIITAKDRLFHFHVADSNRWYPGAGHIDFKQIFSALGKIGYQDFVSAEMLPYPDPDTSAFETVKHLRKFINPEIGC